MPTGVLLVEVYQTLSALEPARPMSTPMTSPPLNRSSSGMGPRVPQPVSRIRGASSLRSISDALRVKASRAGLAARHVAETAVDVLPRGFVPLSLRPRVECDRVRFIITTRAYKVKSWRTGDGDDSEHWKTIACLDASSQCPSEAGERLLPGY